MPGQLKDSSTGMCSTKFVPEETSHLDTISTNHSNIPSAIHIEKRVDSIAEDPEENETTR